MDWGGFGLPFFIQRGALRQTIDSAQKLISS